MIPLIHQPHHNWPPSSEQLQQGHTIKTARLERHTLQQCCPRYTQTSLTRSTYQHQSQTKNQPSSTRSTYRQTSQTKTQASTQSLFLTLLLRHPAAVPVDLTLGQTCLHHRTVPKLGEYLGHDNTSNMLFVTAPVGEEKGGKNTTTPASNQKQDNASSSAVNRDSSTTTTGPFELPGCPVQSPVAKHGSSVSQLPRPRDPAKRSS